MTPIISNILARSDGDVTFKLIGGAIVAAIWVIGAIVNALNKGVEEAKRRRQAQQGSAPPNGPLGMPPVSVQPQRPLALEQQQQLANRAAKAKRRRAAPVAPPRVAVAAPAVAQSLSDRLREMPVEQARVARPAAAAPASQIGRLLRRQDSLRAAFILNEVLSPPLSMRDDGKR